MGGLFHERFHFFPLIHINATESGAPNRFRMPRPPKSQLSLADIERRIALLQRFLDDAPSEAERNAIAAELRELELLKAARRKGRH